MSEIEGLSYKKVLVTGGAGFIGSNLSEYLLGLGCEVICFDNFSTGSFANIKHLILNPKYKLLVGDIRNFEECTQAVDACDYVFHQAALGSVPRSIANPITTNEVNVSGFLNMLVASRDANIKRFVYAASSSTYGDSTKLPKIEDEIGKPLCPYAVTKYVNELYADVFSKTYQMECIGLRYFNVFGRRQNPEGAYAAVIPKFIQLLMKYESPIINGNGTYSRDFTYIDNVIQMNVLAATVDKNMANQVYNVACGERTTLIELVQLLKDNLSVYDTKIANVELKFGENRIGDIPHSLASIEKSINNLQYEPKYDIRSGLSASIQWYWENLK